LEQEPYNILSETDFQKEKQKIEEEEKKLKAAIEEAEKLYSEVSSEMKDLEIKSKQFEELEERLVSVLDVIILIGIGMNSTAFSFS
jgi:beclin 1